MTELVSQNRSDDTPPTTREPAKKSAENASVRPLSVSERSVLEDALEFASETLADDLCAALLSEDPIARTEAQKLLPLLAVGGAAVARVEATVFEAMLDAGRDDSERLRLAHAWKSALYEPARRPQLIETRLSARTIDRRVALVALSTPGCRHGAEVARVALDDVEGHVRVAAFEALVNIALNDDLDTILAAALTLDAEALEPLLGDIVDLCSSAAACAFLEALTKAPCAHKRRLGLLGHRIRKLTCAAGLALTSLNDVDERCRMLALSLLERDGGRTHLESMLPLLGDKSPKVAALARDVAQVLRRRNAPVNASASALPLGAV